MISQQFISLIQLERNAKDNPQDSEKEVIKKKNTKKDSEILLERKSKSRIMYLTKIDSKMLNNVQSNLNFAH